MRHTQKHTPSIGVAEARRPGLKATVVRIEDELHEIIRQRAVREKTSFGEQVRILLEWGLDSAGEEAA